MSVISLFSDLEPFLYRPSTEAHDGTAPQTPATALPLPADADGLRGHLRMSWRIARLAAHLAAGCTRVALLYPLVSERTQRKMRARWSRQLLEVLGIELRARGALPRPGRLLVSNHISWIDVFAINAISPLSFVCKDDVRGWPVIGWLVARNHTVFIRRSSRSSAAEVRDRLVHALARGNSVMVFPEGTTSDGRDVLPFRAALFQSAIDAGRAVKPVRLRYVDHRGEHSEVAPYIDEVNFWQSVCMIARAPRTVAEVELLPELPSHGLHRQDLAALAHARICGKDGPQPV
ncbi:lysophospholipid acyltransferase family protein [Methyloversatilis thermotolerans]|uniref:lysophospholipid acyltransferase family protein n=1 Tax=Methyloversatilis thermotolerans TaxID=1346290 RepID=UPI00036B4A70|nr:lysophospholipid acyltransferase family protein [Methyloversatilis thermotolerans]